MKTFDIIRAWKDARYRSSLSAEEQALLPEHPAGSIELDEDELNTVIGGLNEDEDRTRKVGTAGCCSKYKPKPPAESLDEPADDGGDESC
jgi:mersacidin/lichenicidin family type 2 lantibiotic